MPEPADTVTVETKDGKKISGSSFQVILYSVILSLASSFVTSTNRMATTEANIKHITETQNKFESKFVSNLRFDDLVKAVDKMDTKLDYIIIQNEN